MFPSLYPIALIFSKMRPFDGKINLKSDSPKKKIEMNDINEFYDLFLKAADHKNYLGRLMISQGIHALISYDSIIDKVYF